MEGRTRLRPTTAGIVIAILAVVVLAVDQFTKFLALQNLPYQQTVPVWGDVLHLYLTRNSGAACRVKYRATHRHIDDGNLHGAVGEYRVLVCCIRFQRNGMHRQRRRHRDPT